MDRTNKGFTLIELLVVIAIIALLSSIAIIALQSGRQKSRDAKRLSDMTQMVTAMELYFNANKGYPSTTDDLVPGYTSRVPQSPQPADGGCSEAAYPVGGTGSEYLYYPSPTGGSYELNGLILYPDYSYFFCLGQTTGSFPEGMHWISPKGVR